MNELKILFSNKDPLAQSLSSASLFSKNIDANDPTPSNNERIEQISADYLFVATSLPLTFLPPSMKEYERRKHNVGTAFTYHSNQ